MPGLVIGSQEPQAAGERPARKLPGKERPGSVGQQCLNMIQRVPGWPRQPVASWSVSEYNRDMIMDTTRPISKPQTKKKKNYIILQVYASVNFRIMYSENSIFDRL